MTEAQDTPKELITVENAYDVMIPETPTFAADDVQAYISTLQFAMESPALGEYVSKLPALNGDPMSVKRAADYIQSIFNSFIDSGSKVSPSRISLVKRPANKKEAGTFYDAETGETISTLEMFPVMIMPKRIYWEKGEYSAKPKDGAKSMPVCGSQNFHCGVYYGTKQEKIENTALKARVIPCTTCPLKEFGKKADGSWAGPLCKEAYHVYFVTPKLDKLCELKLDSFCLGKEFKAQDKIKAQARMYPRLVIKGVPSDELKGVDVRMASIDPFSFYLSLTGKVMEDKKGEVTSSGTVVASTTKVLSKEEIQYVKLYQSLAGIYVSRMLISDYNRRIKIIGGDFTVVDNVETVTDDHAEDDFPMSNG